MDGNLTYLKATALLTIKHVSLKVDDKKIEEIHRIIAAKRTLKS